MKVSSKTAIGAITAAALLYVVVGVTAVGQAQGQQSAAEKVPLTDEVFKSVVLFKGIPVDTFFETMGMFASAMGNDCTFCHDSGAYFDKALFAKPW